MTAFLSIASFAFSVAALGVSVFFSLRQTSVARQQTALQERVTAIEEERRDEERRLANTADVTARFLTRDASAPFIPRFYIFLKNSGPAIAHDVMLTFPDSANHLREEKLMDPSVLPIPSLDRGQEFPVQVDMIPGASTFFDVVITWRDDEGSKEKRLRSSWL
jgi:hypothetical protein